MSEGNNAGNILAGIFLLLLGLCVTLVGGGCTVLMLYEFNSVVAGDGMFFMMISVAVLAVGLGLLYVAFRLMTGGFNR